MTAIAGADIIVVGAGIVGTCMAYAAARSRPDASILLLDRGSPGCGASRFSAGFDAIESPNPDHRELARRGRLRYLDMRRDVPAAAVERLTTFWIVPESDVGPFVAGPDASRFEAVDPASALLGRFRLPPSCRIWRDERNGLADAGAISSGIVSHLTASHPRFTFRGRAAVTEIGLQAETSRTLLRTGDGATLWAEHVLVAAGAWLLEPPLRTLVPAGAGLRVKKVASLLIHRAAEPSSPCVVFDGEGAFFLPLHREGAWLFSFTLDAWDASPGDGPVMLTDAERRQGLDALERLAPGLAPYVEGYRVACDVYTPHRMPVIGAAPGLPGVTVVTGCSGAGYRIAPALAEDALDVALAVRPLKPLGDPT